MTNKIAEGLASGRNLDDKACGAAGRSKFAPCFPGRPNPSSACAASSKARDAYRNRRACSRIFNPQPATGGFPYNRRSVAECDPSRIKTDRHEKPEEYGYDERLV